MFTWVVCWTGGNSFAEVFNNEKECSGVLTLRTTSLKPDFGFRSGPGNAFKHEMFQRLRVRISQNENPESYTVIETPLAIG